MKTMMRVLMLTGPVLAGLSLILASEVAAQNDSSRPKGAMSFLSARFEEEIAGLDCRQIADEAQSCFEKCWRRDRAKPMRSCLTSSMRHCQLNCRPTDEVARICRRELPAVFRKCCYLCGPSPVED
jgi:hypothetical protein